RHTRFSRDWSSDVCSSDLGPHLNSGALEVPVLVTTRVIPRIVGSCGVLVPPACHCEMVFVSSAVLRRVGHFQGYFRVLNTAMDRSEERRVGKECRSVGGAD